MTDTPQSWFLQHERLIITVVVVLAVVFVAHGWLDHYYDVAKVAVTTTAQTLSNQQDENKKLEQSYADLKNQFQQTVAQIQSQNTQLAAQASAAVQQAANQQKLDTTLSNQQLANRIEQLANQTNIQSSNQGVTLSHDQSVGVTQQLEDVPTLKTELQSEQQINTNNITEIAGLNKEVSTCTEVNTGLQTQLTDQKKADDAQIKKLKISGIKSRLRWFAVGFVSGFVSGKVW